MTINWTSGNIPKIRLSWQANSKVRLAVSYQRLWRIAWNFAKLLRTELIKDLRPWQFLTMKAAENLCIVYLPPEKHIS